jgi:hypothetical protein
MTAGISLKNFGKIFRFNPNIGPFNWLAGGVFNNTFKNRRAGRHAERHEEYAAQAKNN